MTYSSQMRERVLSATKCPNATVDDLQQQCKGSAIFWIDKKIATVCHR